MKCLDRRSWMEFVDGEISPEQEAVWQEHLRNCRDCRSEVEELRRLRQLVASLPRVPVPEQFQKNISTFLDRADRTSSISRKAPLWRPLLAAACLLVAFFLLFPSSSSYVRDVRSSFPSAQREVGKDESFQLAKVDRKQHLSAKKKASMADLEENFSEKETADSSVLAQKQVVKGKSSPSTSARSPALSPPVPEVDGEDLLRAPEFRQSPGPEKSGKKAEEQKLRRSPSPRGLGEVEGIEKRPVSSIPSVRYRYSSRSKKQGAGRGRNMLQGRKDAISTQEVLLLSRLPLLQALAELRKVLPDGAKVLKVRWGRWEESIRKGHYLPPQRAKCLYVQIALPHPADLPWEKFRSHGLALFSGERPERAKVWHLWIYLSSE